MKPHILKDGRTVYLDRRRYGNRTYCWAYAKVEQYKFMEILADPWPAVTPPDAEMAQGLDAINDELIEKALGPKRNS